MLTILKRMLQTELYQAVLVGIVLLAAAQAVEEKGIRGVLRGMKPWKCLFWLYASFLLYGTLLGRTTIVDPLSSVVHGFRFDYQSEGNVVAFIPLSMLLLLAYRPKNGFVTATVVAGCLSVFIELSQLITRLGTFQISDLVFNLLGGAVGAGLGCGIRVLADYRKSKRRRTK